MPVRRLLCLLAATLSLTGCGVAIGGSRSSQTAGGTQVRLAVFKGAHGATAAFAPVFIDGKGPFPFELDTGAARSAVSTRLAQRLGLRPTGKTVPVTGIVSTESAGTVKIARWRVGGVRLRPETAFALRFAGLGSNGPAGLLGSDVLSRFPSISVDYQAETLSLGGTVAGGGTRVPLRVVKSSGNSTLVFAPVYVAGKGPLPFTLDTGAAESLVERGVAERLGLDRTGKSEEVSGIASSERAIAVHVGRWSVGRKRLVPQTLFSIRLPAKEAGSISGLLGSDVLSRFAAIAIDYRSGTLTLRGRG